LPELASPTSRTKYELDGINFGDNIDAFCRLSHPGQGMRKALSSAQQALAMPATHINRHAAFTGNFANESMASPAGSVTGENKDYR
jgi:hypothetical protein